MRSWTDAGADRTREAWSDAARDLGHLVRFRMSTVRRRGPLLAGLVVLLVLTVAFVEVPPRLRAVSTGSARDVMVSLSDALTDNFGPALAAFVLLGIGASMGGGGGRELISRNEVVVHPVGPRAEHLGSLVLTPLNLAWLLQVWSLLAATSLVVERHRLPGALLVVVLWIAAATTAAQAIGWAIEGVRRTTHGVAIVRSVVIGVGVLAALAHLAGHLTAGVRALPTTDLAEALRAGQWELPAVALAVAAVAFGWLGGLPAAWALGMPAREELRVASGVHEARPLPRPRWLDADLALLRRLDRGSVWRSVGMRRGLMVLGLGPGLVALVGSLSWSSIALLPGLAASGAALLFGVNAWCLDAKGMVWRESLPVEAAKVFDARALVIAECLAVVSGFTVTLAVVRNGVPPLQVALSVGLCWLVVVMQVLATSLWWSVRSPYAVDLSSPRATPAPHAVMANYAGRLSLVTTLTGMLFASFARVDVWWLPVVFAAGFLMKSVFKLLKARRRWLDAPERARLALTVAAV